MATKIVIIGSCNIDLTVYCETFPLPGQTILGSELIIGPGGKGLNQATAAARLEGDTTFISKIGSDVLAQTLLSHFGSENINTEHISRSATANSGTASITVELLSGENMIIVTPGANRELCPEDVLAAQEKIADSDVLLAQLEVGPLAVWQGFKLAKEHKVLTVLNPAPPCDIPSDIWPLIDFFTPNESEAKYYTGIDITDEDTALKACRALHDRGVGCAIITLGAVGAAYFDGTTSLIVHTTTLKAIDTVGAGDAFNAALSLALARGMEGVEAVKYANSAASLCVTRKGAATSMPYKKEVDLLYREHYH